MARLINRWKHSANVDSSVRLSVRLKSHRLEFKQSCRESYYLLLVIVETYTAIFGFDKGCRCHTILIRCKHI